MFSRFNINEIKEKELAYNQNIRMSEIPGGENNNCIERLHNNNNIISEENNNLIFVRAIDIKESKNSLGFTNQNKYLNDPVIKLSRKNLHDADEREEKKALGEIYNFIRYKFSNNKENELEGNFNLDLNIPYKVNISYIFYISNLIIFIGN